MKKRIVLTGGGTAGHVTPNIALIPTLQKHGYEIHYIGSYDGIEKKLIEDFDIPYYGISSGKLRRYFDPKNFSDPFRVVKGYTEASALLKKIKPHIVFSKGGFVSVPVVVAARRHKIPAIIHESDNTPGLANKICIPFCTKVCANFPETLSCLPAEKAVLTGTPIRRELFCGDRLQGLRLTGFSSNKPILLVIGGSLGSSNINHAVRSILPTLLEEFQIIHLCGTGKLDPALKNTQGYLQLEYAKEELADLFCCADLVISRAGANAICELLALRKPNILIPLSANSSRGDQILNAESFAKQSFSYVLPEEKLSNLTLLEAIHSVYENRTEYMLAMTNSPLQDAASIIMNLIQQTAL